MAGRGSTPVPAWRSSCSSPTSLAAAAVIIFVLGASRWFIFADDEDFLIRRSAFDLGGLFQPHRGHWVTLPVLVYRAVFWLFGLDYRAYLVVLVVAHLGTAALLRLIMRRAGVGPWPATAVAAVLVLFGPGGEDILWSFQITFVGAIAFGLIQLVLADHDGGLDRRDVLGLLAGAAALMCSAVGPAMVVAVGMAVLLRRGWRIAAFHVVPLATLFTIWYLTHLDAIGEGVDLARPGGLGTGRVLRHHLAHGDRPVRLARRWPGGRAAPRRGDPCRSRPGLATAELASLANGREPARGPVHRGRHHAPLLSGSRSSSSLGIGTESRYLYLFVACALPILAVAVDALARRWIPVGVGPARADRGVLHPQRDGVRLDRRRSQRGVLPGREAGAPPGRRLAAGHPGTTLGSAR